MCPLKCVLSFGTKFTILKTVYVLGRTNGQQPDIDNVLIMFYIRNYLHRGIVVLPAISFNIPKQAHAYFVSNLKTDYFDFDSGLLKVE